MKYLISKGADVSVGDNEEVGIGLLMVDTQILRLS